MCLVYVTDKGHVVSVHRTVLNCTYLEVLVLDARPVQLWVSEDGGGGDVHVVDPQHEDGDGGVHEVEELDGPFRVVLLTRPRVVEVEPELRHAHENVLVEHVLHHAAHSDVVEATVFE